MKGSEVVGLFERTNASVVSAQTAAMASAVTLAKLGSGAQHADALLEVAERAGVRFVDLTFPPRTAGAPGACWGRVGDVLERVAAEHAQRGAAVSPAAPAPPTAHAVVQPGKWSNATALSVLAVFGNAACTGGAAAEQHLARLSSGGRGFARVHVGPFAAVKDEGAVRFDWTAAVVSRSAEEAVVVDDLVPFGVTHTQATPRTAMHTAAPAALAASTPTPTPTSHAWIPLLEKAIAKLAGGYSALQAIPAPDALAATIGAVTRGRGTLVRSDAFGVTGGVEGRLPPLIDVAMMTEAAILLQPHHGDAGEGVEDATFYTVAGVSGARDALLVYNPVVASTTAAAAAAAADDANNAHASPALRAIDAKWLRLSDFPAHFAWWGVVVDAATGVHVTANPCPVPLASVLEEKRGSARPVVQGLGRGLRSGGGVAVGEVKVSTSTATVRTQAHHHHHYRREGVEEMAPATNGGVSGSGIQSQTGAFMQGGTAAGGVGGSITARSHSGATSHSAVGKSPPIPLTAPVSLASLPRGPRGASLEPLPAAAEQGVYADVGDADAVFATAATTTTTKMRVHAHARESATTAESMFVARTWGMHAHDARDVLSHAKDAGPRAGASLGPLPSLTAAADAVDAAVDLKGSSVHQLNLHASAAAAAAVHTEMGLSAGTAGMGAAAAAAPLTTLPLTFSVIHGLDTHPHQPPAVVMPYDPAPRVPRGAAASDPLHIPPHVPLTMAAAAAATSPRAAATSTGFPVPVTSPGGGVFSPGGVWSYRGSSAGVGAPDTLVGHARQAGMSRAHMLAAAPVAAPVTVAAPRDVSDIVAALSRTVAQLQSEVVARDTHPPTFLTSAAAHMEDASIAALERTVAALRAELRARTADAAAVAPPPTFVPSPSPIAATAAAAAAAMPPLTTTTTSVHYHHHHPAVPGAPGAAGGVGVSLQPAMLATPGAPGAAAAAMGLNMGIPPIEVSDHSVVPPPAYPLRAGSTSITTPTIGGAGPPPPPPPLPLGVELTQRQPRGVGEGAADSLLSSEPPAAAAAPPAAVPPPRSPPVYSPNHNVFTHVAQRSLLSPVFSHSERVGGSSLSLGHLVGVSPPVPLLPPPPPPPPPPAVAARGDLHIHTPQLNPGAMAVADLSGISDILAGDAGAAGHGPSDSCLGGLASLPAVLSSVDAAAAAAVSSGTLIAEVDAPATTRAAEVCSRRGLHSPVVVEEDGEREGDGEAAATVARDPPPPASTHTPVVPPASVVSEATADVRPPSGTADANDVVTRVDRAVGGSQPPSSIANSTAKVSAPPPPPAPPAAADEDVTRRLTALCTGQEELMANVAEIYASLADLRKGGADPPAAPPGSEKDTQRGEEDGTPKATAGDAVRGAPTPTLTRLGERRDITPYRRGGGTAAAAADNQGAPHLPITQRTAMSSDVRRVMADQNALMEQVAAVGAGQQELMASVVGLHAIVRALRDANVVQEERWAAVEVAQSTAAAQLDAHHDAIELLQQLVRDINVHSVGPAVIARGVHPGAAAAPAGAVGALAATQTTLADTVRDIAARYTEVVDVLRSGKDMAAARTQTPFTHHTVVAPASVTPPAGAADAGVDAHVGGDAVVAGSSEDGGGGGTTAVYGALQEQRGVLERTLAAEQSKSASLAAQIKQLAAEVTASEIRVAEGVARLSTAESEAVRYRAQCVNLATSLAQREHEGLLAKQQEEDALKAKEEAMVYSRTAERLATDLANTHNEKKALEMSLWAEVNRSDGLASALADAHDALQKMEVAALRDINSQVRSAWSGLAPSDLATRQDTAPIVQTKALATAPVLSPSRLRDEPQPAPAPRAAGVSVRALGELDLPLPVAVVHETHATATALGIDTPLLAASPYARGPQPVGGATLDTTVSPPAVGVVPTGAATAGGGASDWEKEEGRKHRGVSPTRGGKAGGGYASRAAAEGYANRLRTFAAATSPPVRKPPVPLTSPTRQA